MTEADNSPATQTFAIVQRRLVGLAVLLLFAFLLSLLLRGGSGGGAALPSVVIPLGGTRAAVDPAESIDTAPTLDVPAFAEMPRSEPSTVAAEKAAPELSQASPGKPAPVSKPATSKPVVPALPAPPKPRTEKPAPAGVEKSLKTAPPAAAPVKPQPPRRWVVVGAYKDPMAAQAIVNRIQRAGLKAGSVGVMQAGERLLRVRAGPFATAEDAESARVTLIVDGLTKSTIVVEK